MVSWFLYGAGQVVSISGSSALAQNGGPAQPVWGSGGFHVKQWGEITLRNLHLPPVQQQPPPPLPLLSVSGDGKLHLASMDLPWRMLKGLLLRGLQWDSVVGQQQGKSTLTSSLSGKTAAARGWSGGGKTTLGAGFCNEVEAAMCQPPSCWPEIYRFTGTVQFTNGGATHEHIPGDFKKTKVMCVLCCLPCMC